MYIKEVYNDRITISSQLSCAALTYSVNFLYTTSNRISLLDLFRMWANIVIPEVLEWPSNMRNFFPSRFRYLICFRHTFTHTLQVIFEWFLFVSMCLERDDFDWQTAKSTNFVRTRCFGLVWMKNGMWRCTFVALRKENDWTQKACLTIIEPLVLAPEWR